MKLRRERVICPPLFGMKGNYRVAPTAALRVAVAVAVLSNRSGTSSAVHHRGRRFSVVIEHVDACALAERQAFGHIALDAAAGGVARATHE